MWARAVGVQSGQGEAITDIPPQEVEVCLGGGVRDFAKLLATAAPSGLSRVSWRHPVGLWAQEWMTLLKMTKKK